VDIADKLQKLMDERGLTTYRLAKETGVSYTGLTKILNKQTRHPQIDSLKLVADYFHKPLDYFTDESENGLTSDPYALTRKEENDIAKRLEKIMADLESDTALAYHGEPLDDEEDREALRASIENTLRLSKYMAKKKFTPNKYRK
jgi:transcriptional regulator with XRE-family HTH domain